MFGFLGKFSVKRKRSAPVICERAAHCISRRNIDPDALRVLYRLSDRGYTAYLVGGGVRDLLLGRTPKDFDVGTNATPNEVKRVFRNCFLIGRRFRLAHVRFAGGKVIETATFRQNPQTVGEIIEHAAEGPQEDNTFGTPETDAHRRDFTVNGLFYDIKTYAVIDWVGGLEDLKKRLIRSIGDPMIRFREDPVRMMRAVKFASRLDFAIERKTERAIRRLHACILTAAVPRLCEEVFRLFPYGASAKAFRMMYEFGLLGDLLPELAAFIDKDGGVESSTWKYLATLDRYEKAMRARGGALRGDGARAARPCVRNRRHDDGEPAHPQDDLLHGGAAARFRQAAGAAAAEEPAADRPQQGVPGHPRLQPHRGAHGRARREGAGSVGRAVPSSVQETR